MREDVLCIRRKNQILFRQNADRLVRVITFGPRLGHQVLLKKIFAVAAAWIERLKGVIDGIHREAEDSYSNNSCGQLGSDAYPPRRS